ncbi:phospholipase D-like domain-containing protein [Flavobacterium sp.]|uniref:phospholipase D-like domain-containing protein n=1 Tax=Flavobacterium sp. TaxID=239 RepID=UPI0025BAEFED|nr:phospholipase D-like domain-containing protein [Flavobacterium sp.]
MKTEVFFSNIKKEIISKLRNSNTSIRVAVAWLTDEDIIRELKLKSEQGVNVTVVISNAKENFKSTSKFKDFIKNKGKLYIATQKFMHNKFCILDDTIIINGSYNWTYYACSSEENIMILYIDKSIKQDLDILNKFNSKYNYFCNKLSQLILHPVDLENYKEVGKDVSIVLSILDETEINLRQDLENDVKKSIAEAISINIPISNLLLERMKIDGGGVEFIKRILHDEITSGDMKSGFKRLEEPIPHRVDLSLEFLVTKPKYNSLFSEIEIEFCKKLMSKYNLL